MLLLYATAVGCTAVCFGAEEKIHINSFILVLFYLLIFNDGVTLHFFYGILL